MTKARREAPKPTRPTRHVSPVFGCRCDECQHLVARRRIQRAAERAAREDRRMLALGHLATLGNYLDGIGSVEVGANATDALVELLGARRRR